MSQIYSPGKILLQSVGILVVVSMMNSILIIPSAVLLVAFYFARKFYMIAASKIALLESISKKMLLFVCGCLCVTRL